MSDLLKVAEGILDDATSEFLKVNLDSVDSVKGYAENGCGVYLSDEEAEKVLNVCRSWVSGAESGELNGTNDYYYTVKKPLIGSEAAI